MYRKNDVTQAKMNEKHASKPTIPPNWRLLSKDNARTTGYAKDQERTIIELAINAMPVYNAVADAYINQYNENKRHDYGSKHEEKVQGIIGNEAIHATLNECGIFYRTDQLFASYASDRVWHDFVLAPSGVNLEIKTSGAEAKYLSINKNHWQNSKMPDVIMSLRVKEANGRILIEFAGWCYASEVDNFEFIAKANPKKSYFRRKITELHKPIDLAKFLASLARNGLRLKG